MWGRPPAAGERHRWMLHLPARDRSANTHLLPPLPLTSPSSLCSSALSSDGSHRSSNQDGMCDLRVQAWGAPSPGNAGRVRAVLCFVFSPNTSIVISVQKKIGDGIKR